MTKVNRTPEERKEYTNFLLENTEKIDVFKFGTRYFKGTRTDLIFKYLNEAPPMSFLEFLIDLNLEIRSEF